MIAAMLLISTAAFGAAPDSGESPIQALDHARTLIRGGHIDAGVGILATLLPSLDSPTDKNEARYLLGRLLTERGQAAGLAHLEALPKPFGETEDRRRVWLARARAMAAHDDRALQALTDALKMTLEVNEKANLQILRAEVRRNLAGKDGPPPKGAIEDLKAVEQGSASRHVRSQALKRRAQWLTTSDPKASLQAWRRLFIHFPDTVAGLSDDVPLRPEELTDSERMKRAQVLIRFFVYGPARDDLRRLMDHKKYGAEARWLVALIGIRKLRDNPDEARELLKRIIKRGGKHKEEAHYLLARTYLKQDKYGEALKILDRYDRLYPRGQWRESAAYYRAFIPYDERRHADAIAPIRSYIDNFGRRRHTVKGFLGWCYIRLGRWKEAIKAYDALISGGGPLGRGKAYYWQAYALDKLDRREQATKLLRKLRAEYPLTWYDIHGQRLLASWEGRSTRTSDLPWPKGGGDLAERYPVDIDVWDWPRLRGRNLRTLKRVRALLEIGEVDLARRSYKEIRSAAEKSVAKSKRMRFIHVMTHLVEDFKHGWRTVSGGRLSAMMKLPERPDESWATLYPLAYKDLVASQAPDFKVPAFFVYAIMRQESRYHPAMISSMDAIGALQMIPQTAILVGQDMGTPYDPETFPDPRVGFPFTFRYMEMHDTLWKGQLTLTAASYNAGPEPIRRWLRENDQADLSFLVEEFSYNEARAYARRVAEHMTRYLFLYEGDEARRKDLLDRLFPDQVRYDISDDIGF
ncbi:MAG: transglycosylase SLT domain-containing protein [Myxococcota bacterium]|nr:transglycosylase SLT domain-containing protein [Myxococcota bacterium]